MRDLKQIELALIKNLELIHFYNIEHAPYISLSITYDNNKTLTYDYKYPNFNAYLSRVIEVYKNEKDTRKINFLDEPSKNLMESLLIDNPYEKEIRNYTNRDIKYLSRHNDVRFLFEYIKVAISQFLSVMYNTDIIVDQINGYRDRYTALYKYDNEERFVPFILIKQDFSNYIFKFTYVSDQVIGLTGNINLYSGSVSLNYDSKSGIEAKNNYVIDQGNKELIRYNDQIISYNDPTYEVDTNFLDSYLTLLGLPILENKVGTVPNNYLLDGNIDNNTKYATHLSLQDNFSNAKVEKSYGTFRNDIYVLLDKEQIDINVFLEKNSLIIEKNYINYGYTYEEYETDIDSLITKDIKGKVKKK